MRYVTAMAVCASILLAIPAAGQQQEVDFKSIMSGRPPVGSTITQQGPFTVVTIPIPDDQLPMLRAMAGFGLDEDGDATPSGDAIAAKPFALAVGADLFKPSIRSGVTSNDVAPLDSTDYFYYWVSVSFNSNT